MKYLMLFHDKHFYANAPQCDVIRTLPLLLSFDFYQNYNVWKIFCITYFCCAWFMFTASLEQRVSKTPNFLLVLECLKSPQSRDYHQSTKLYLASSSEEYRTSEQQRVAQPLKKFPSYSTPQI